MRTRTHEQVATEVRDKRRHLMQRGLTAEQIAAVAGLSVKALSQCSQYPGTRGARLISGEQLDALRERAAIEEALHWSRAVNPFQPREERQWLVYDQEGNVLTDVTDERFAHRYAARFGGIAARGPRNRAPSRMQDGDWLHVNWIDVRHGGYVTKANAMAVTNTDEWTEGLLGFASLGWPMAPTRREYYALSSFDVDRRPDCHAA